MDPTLALAVDPLVGLPPLVSLSHGLLGLAVLTGLGLGVLRLTGALPRLTTLERLIVAYPLGWLPAYAAIMALGSLARLDQATLVPLLAFGALLAVPGWVLFIRTDCPANRGIDRPWTIGEYLLLAGLLTFGALSWIQALSPPNTYDSLMYHLTGPRYSVEAGTLAVPFDRVLAQLLFPQGIGHVTRLMLVLSSAEAVQLLIGALTFIAAGAIYALAARLSFSRSVGLWGAVLFLGLRVVAWQIAAAETDLPVTACTLAALLVWTIWRSGVALPSAKSMALAVLFGFLLGVGILFKLHGFVIAFILGLLLLADSVGKKVRLSAVLLAAVVAFLTILPHLIWAFWVTGNPIFPLFHDHIRPDALSVYEDVGALYGTGRGWADLWAVMVTLSLAPMHYFDGMVLGAPYLLALAPLGFLAGRARKLAPLALFAGGYGFIWFFLLSEQVRFLLPVLPVICLFAGLGLVSLWQGVKSAPALRAVFPHQQAGMPARAPGPQPGAAMFGLGLAGYRIH
ncbi:MAG: glycosyltransferase family 39 protein, partial [Rhodospirillales bacterium]